MKITKDNTTDVTKALIQKIASIPDIDANDIAWHTLKDIIINMDPMLEILPAVFAANRNATFEVALVMSIFNRLMKTIDNNPGLDIQIGPPEQAEEAMNEPKIITPDRSEDSLVSPTDSEGDSEIISDLP